MINIITCMTIDPYYFVLAVGQMVSWAGIITCSIYCIKKVLAED